MALTSEQEGLAQELMDLLLAAGLNPAPYVTKLVGAFESANRLARDLGDFPEATITALEDSAQIAGTMAANNLQGTEHRRAAAANDVAIQYPEFRWVPKRSGTIDSRVADVTVGMEALGRSVNAVPPTPPVEGDLQVNPLVAAVAAKSRAEEEGLLDDRRGQERGEDEEPERRTGKR